MIRYSLVLWLVLATSGCARLAGKPKEAQSRERDELSALWSFYKHTYVRDGRTRTADVELQDLRRN